MTYPTQKHPHPPAHNPTTIRPGTSHFVCTRQTEEGASRTGVWPAIDQPQGSSSRGVSTTLLPPWAPLSHTPYIILETPRVICSFLWKLLP